jgi:hypothetical protein
LKLRLALLFVVLLALAIGAGAYWLLGRSGDAAAAYAALLPTGPIDCPDEPDDLAGIEGWAPGAGKAEKMGQNDQANLGGFGSALGGAPATPAPAASKACVGLRSDVAAGFDTIAQRIKLVPTGSFDPAVRGADFATPDAAFAFVRDSIHTEGYAGAMRGASGTLQSFGGSPADKALLLAALLAHAQVPVRFVHGPLADADLALAVAAVNAPPPAPASPPLDDAFKALGIDPVQARADAAAVRKRVEADANAAIADARNATDDVLATFSSENVKLSSDPSSATARWSANLRDHWWLQAQENGAWVDLDPTLPNAASGTHLGGTPADAPSDALPDAELATLTVRLTADRFANGAAPQTATLVERTVKLVDAYAQPLTISIGDHSLGSDKIAQANAFTPAISFAGNDESGSTFDTTGLGVVRLQVETALGGVVHHVASRIVLDARAPNGTALDPAWDVRRYAYALTTVYDVLPVAGEIDPAFAGLREAGGMQTLRAFMAYAAAGGNGKQMLPPGVAETYPMQALHYFEYDALTRRLLEDGSNGAVRFYFDRAQIAIERRGFDASGSVPAGIVSFDIADNGMIAAGSDRAASVRANVTRGYVDTESEQKLFAGPNDGGTIALFAAAKSAGVALTVLQGDQYGGTALAPVKSVALAGRDRMGWWAIDPQDGNLVGRMGPDGAGQELAEYAIARANDWSTLYSMISFYGDFFRCIAGTVEAPLSGVNAQQFFTQCAGAAICSYLEALAAGEAYSRWGSDEEALLYNILDLSIPGTKDSWPGSGGAVCGALFKSPLY